MRVSPAATAGFLNMAPTADAMPKLGKQGCKHFQSPRINTTVSRKERTISLPDFMKKGGKASLFLGDIRPEI